MSKSLNEKTSSPKNDEPQKSRTLEDLPLIFAQVEFLEKRVKRLEEVCLELTQVLSETIKHIQSQPRR